MQKPCVAMVIAQPFPESPEVAINEKNPGDGMKVVQHHLQAALAFQILPLLSVRE